jgi:hypothetical protein
MIAAQVVLTGPDGSEIELRLETGRTGFEAIFMTQRGPDGIFAPSVKLNRGLALAVSNILSGWGSELPV